MTFPGKMTEEARIKYESVPLTSNLQPQLAKRHGQQAAWMEMFRNLEEQHRRELEAQHLQHQNTLLQLQKSMEDELLKQQHLLQQRLLDHRQILKKLPPHNQISDATILDVTEHDKEKTDNQRTCTSENQSSHQKNDVYSGRCSQRNVDIIRSPCDNKKHYFSSTCSQHKDIISYPGSYKKSDIASNLYPHIHDITRSPRPNRIVDIASSRCSHRRGDSISSPCQHTRDNLVNSPCWHTRDETDSIPCPHMIDTTVSSPCLHRPNEIVSSACQHIRDDTLEISDLHIKDDIVSSPCVSSEDDSASSLQPHKREHMVGSTCKYSRGDNNRSLGQKIDDIYNCSAKDQIFISPDSKNNIVKKLSKSNLQSHENVLNNPFLCKGDSVFCNAGSHSQAAIAKKPNLSSQNDTPPSTPSRGGVFNSYIIGDDEQVSGSQALNQGHKFRLTKYSPGGRLSKNHLKDHRSMNHYECVRSRNQCQGGQSSSEEKLGLSQQHNKDGHPGTANSMSANTSTNCSSFISLQGVPLSLKNPPPLTHCLRNSPDSYPWKALADPANINVSASQKHLMNQSWVEETRHPRGSRLSDHHVPLVNNKLQQAGINKQLAIERDGVQPGLELHSLRPGSGARTFALNAPVGVGMSGGRSSPRSLLMKQKCKTSGSHQVTFQDDDLPRLQQGLEPLPISHEQNLADQNHLLHIKCKYLQEAYNGSIIQIRKLQHKVHELKMKMKSQEGMMETFDEPEAPILNRPRLL